MALSALLFKGRRLFRNGRSTSHPQSTTNVPPAIPPQKQFKKSNDVRRDISVLAMTYILQDNPAIQELILLIIGLHDHDDNKLSEIVALSAMFTVQLASFHEEDSSRASTAVTAFLTTMRDIDGMVRNETETANNMDDMVKDSIGQIKNTFPPLANRNTGGDKGLSCILNTITGTTITILDVLNEAIGVIPVPFVQPLVAIIAGLLKAVDQTHSNFDDMRQVATVAGEFVVTLAVVCCGDEVEPSLRFQQALDRFQKKLYDIAQQYSKLSSRNVFWRFLQQEVDKNSISAIKDNLQNAIQQFQTEAQVLQHLDLCSLGEVINGKLDEDAVNALPNPLSYVGRRDQYLAGSRSDVIQIIADWLEHSNQLTFWMHGGAGLGKSTLAHKIVDSLQAESRLATFAFLARGSSSDAATVIRAMAKELGALHPRAIPKVAAAARTCNSSHLPLREYMESYIITPIRSLSYPYPLVVVIDALDEWEHHEVFLEELEHIPQSSPVKILLISRPNHSIGRSLLKVPVEKYQLPPVSQAVTEEYFKYHFEQMDWKIRKPSPTTICDLARLADGLLIWAAMVCSFLSYDMRAGAPHELLEQILSSGKQIALKGQLSNLYHDALKQLFRDDEEQKLFQRVFGAMTVLQESLPLPDFACLLEMSEDQVKGVQTRLTALQTRGTYDEHTVPPASERFHSSLVEFTMNREAEAGKRLIHYPINPQMAHESIAEGCLDFLNRFLLSFRGSTCIHSDLRGLELYAVKFFPLHVANSNDRLMPLAPKLENLLLKLADTHLRRWGSWFLAISLPSSSQNWDQILGRVHKDELYCSLAEFLENKMTMDTTLASRTTFCLEVAVRLQPEHEKTWEDLGNSYRKRFDSTGNLDLLNNAITVYRHTLELCSKDGSHLTAKSSLASALNCRFRRTSSMKDLDEAISMHRETLFLRPRPHPDHYMSVNGLADALQDRYRETGLMADLEESIAILRDSLPPDSTPHSDHSMSLNSLGFGLWNRFVGTGSMTDLEEAISISRETLFLLPIPHPDRSMSLSHLGIALAARFRKTDSMTDLEEAILRHRESLVLRPPTHPDHYKSLNNLANSLRDRFRKTGSRTDLEEAILLHRQSLFLRPKPHPGRSRSLTSLALVLLDRFGKTGSMIDLEEAIPMHRESLSLRPPPHPERAVSLNNLGSTLRARFGKTGSMTDLEEAILLFRESLSFRPPPDPNRPISLNNLAIALRDRFGKTGLMSDIEEAIPMLRESLSLHPAGHPGRPDVLSNLASVLETRFEENSVQSDLDEATTLRQEILAISQ